MNHLFKYLAYGLGSLTLVAGSFFLFTAVSGTPLSKVGGVGKLFPERPEAPATSSRELPEIETLLENDTRSSDQIFDAARSPFATFTLQDPFSEIELARLENLLHMRKDQLDKREASLDERERFLDQDEEALKRRFDDLERLKAQILDESEDQRARTEELAAGEKAQAARESELYKSMAPLYEDNEPEVASRMLMNMYAPEEAAKVLEHMSDDRVRELLEAIHASDPAKHKEYSRAYSLHVSRRAKAPGGGAQGRPTTSR